MDNSTDRSQVPNDGLKPSERFVRALRTVLSVTPVELAEQEARSKAEGGARPHGPPKGTPNWRTKRREAIDQPIQ